MMVSKSIKLVECPRDAMQGWKTFIPTAKKAAYINSLLEVGFDTIDFGSFVSPKAIPQMADTAEVLSLLNTENKKSKLLAIIANLRGAEEACTYSQIDCLGYPFSISETFQLRNTNAGIDASLERVEDIQELCLKTRKQLVVYISMGFGNPYGDPYSPALVTDWVGKLTSLGVQVISLADTVGIAEPVLVKDITGQVIRSFPDTEIGVHLHSSPANWKEKIEAADSEGCLRFDGALNGIGGCPMADDILVGNMDSNLMIGYFNKSNRVSNINMDALNKSLAMAREIFAA